jgi:uncharacterized membrane protein YqjE
MSEEGHSAGLMGSLGNLAGTALEAVRTRIELLGLEIAEERERLFRLLIWGGIAVLLLAVGILSALVLLVLAFWEQRLWLLGCLTLALLLGGALMVSRLLGGVTHRPHPFQSSVDELSEDIRKLRAAARDHPDASPD